MKRGYFYSHQGWSDIINCLPLVTYYSRKYDELVCYYREDSKELVNYYLSSFKNTRFESDKNINLLNGDILFHGIHDIRRNDSYRNRFNNSDQSIHFVERFYTCYDIPYMEIINSFNLTRNNELEELNYKNFIDKNKCVDYILYHEPSYNSIQLQTNKFYNKINLDNITNNTFLYIKVLENAKEIHLADSTWAAMCYLLDCRYQIFKNKKINIFIYPYDRSGALLKDKYQKNIKPVRLNNWNVI